MSRPVYLVLPADLCVPPGRAKDLVLRTQHCRGYTISITTVIGNAFLYRTANNYLQDPRLNYARRAHSQDGPHRSSISIENALASYSQHQRQHGVDDVTCRRARGPAQGVASKCECNRVCGKRERREDVLGEAPSIVHTRLCADPRSSGLLWSPTVAERRSAQYSWT